MLIGLSEAMPLFDFGFTRLKVKVTRVTCKKCTHGVCSLSWEILVTALIFYMLMGLDRDMTHIDIEVIRSNVKVRRITFVKQWFPLFILRNIYHRAVILLMLIGLGKAMSPFGFGFTRLRVQVTSFTCKNVHMVWAHYLKNLSHSFHISHTDWSW